MAIEIVVPRLGWSMEEGVFGQWLHEPGTQIQPGDLLYVLEGEKAAQDIESFDGGILHVPVGAPVPGETVQVGQLLGYLLAEGEEPPAAPLTRKRKGDVAGAAEGIASPSMLPGNPTVPSPGQAAERPLISPRARRIADELGIEWLDLSGTGSGGRIREKDILAAAGRAIPTDGSDSELPGELRPASRIRRTIARRMQESVQQVVPVTLVARVNATSWIRFRRQAREASRLPVPTYNDMLAKVVAEALAEYPVLNSQWRGQMLFEPNQVNLAFAVDTKEGLLAPVLQDVGSRSLQEIADASSALIGQVQDGTVREDDLRGATFTITNLGMYGVDEFTPVVTLPQCATLGVGQIKPVAVVEEGEVVVQDQVTLSLTFDHRVVDGAPAARFLARVRRGIEEWPMDA